MTPEQRYSEIVKTFRARPRGVMKEWLELGLTSRQDWASLAEEAMAFVSGTPK